MVTVCVFVCESFSNQPKQIYRRVPNCNSNQVELQCLLSFLRSNDVLAKPAIGAGSHSHIQTSDFFKNERLFVNKMRKKVQHHNPIKNSYFTLCAAFDPLVSSNLSVWHMQFHFECIFFCINSRFWPLKHNTVGSFE